MNLTLADITALILAITSIGVTVFKMRSEVKKTSLEADASGADAVESYAAATKTYSEEVLRLRQELATTEYVHRQEIKELKAGYERTITDNRKQRIEFEQKLEESQRQITALQDWAKRLSAQLVSLGVEPVPMTPK